jgi:hypothetical protein
MDALIAGWPSVLDADLRFCIGHEVAYQADMTKGRVAYDAAYLENYDRYAAGPIANRLLARRLSFLIRHVPDGASVLDVGAASGIFVRAARLSGYDAKGFDVIPEARARLRAVGNFGDEPGQFDAVTLFDSLEHMEDPGAYLGRVRVGAVVLVAIPVFDLGAVRQSKHYKPGEHLYYWTAHGFIEWMALQGFVLLEQSGHEVEAGRESIAAFAFRYALG